jgi:hypothetical protein
MGRACLDLMGFNVAALQIASVHVQGQISAWYEEGMRGSPCFAVMRKAFLSHLPASLVVHTPTSSWLYPWPWLTVFLLREAYE